MPVGMQTSLTHAPPQSLQVESVFIQIQNSTLPYDNDICFHTSSYYISYYLVGLVFTYYITVLEFPLVHSSYTIQNVCSCMLISHAVYSLSNAVGHARSRYVKHWINPRIYIKQLLTLVKF